MIAAQIAAQIGLIYCINGLITTIEDWQQKTIPKYGADFLFAGLIPPMGIRQKIGDVD